MDEAEWLACNDPGRMLEFLRGMVSDRKFRLFAVACCQLIAHRITDPNSRRAIQAAEQYADGLISLDTLREARATAPSSRMGGATLGGLRTGRSGLARATSPSSTPGGAPHARDAARATTNESSWTAARDAQRRAMQQIWEKARLSWETAPVEKAAAYNSQRAILRDIFGNPFRPVLLNPAWRTPAVLSLAQAAYENRLLSAGTLDPDRLAILADALEESGCTDAAILRHLREPGPHVRGCHVLDLLLGKE